MAVDFSSRATDVTSTIEPNTVVQNPVSREGELDALGQIGRGIGNAARVAGAYIKNKDAMDANKRLAKFNLDLSTLQDAENQGLSTSEVMTRARRRLQQELANNPGAEEDILARYSTWQSQSGYNKISTPDIQRAEIEQANAKAAVDNGFLRADQINDPAAVSKATDELEAFRTATRELELSSKEIANKNAALQLKGTEKAAAQAEAEETIINGLAKVGQKALPYWRTQYENIKAAAGKASSEQERQEILKQGVIQLEQDFAQRTAALAGDSLNVNQAKIDQVLAPQKALIDAYKKELSGEYDLDTLDRQVKTTEARTKMLVYQGMTDEQRQWIATASMLGPAAVVLQGKLSGIVVDMFQKNSTASGVTTGSPDDRGQPAGKPADLTYGDASGKANVKNYLDAVTKSVEQLGNGVFDKQPEQKAQMEREIDAQMKGILKGVNVYGNSTESADQFQPLIDFFANPTVGAYLQKSGGIPAQIRGEVAKVFQDGYQTQVVPLLKEELDKMYSRNMKDVAPGGKLMVSVGEVVEPTMEGGRFGFKLKAGVPSDPMVNGIVRTMNNSTFTKVLNKMVISDAHIQGTNDYKKSFETISPYLFGGQGTTEGSGDQSGLDLGDFEDDRIQPVNFVPAETNPNIDQEVLDRFAGRRLPVSIRNNNMGAVSITGDVASSWAAQQPGFVGVTKRPKNEGGYYAAYATPEAGVAAASKLLERYGEKGTNTASKIVKKWSTDTGAHGTYANTLVKYLNEAGYEVTNTDALDLSDPGVRLAILKAKSAHEAGAGKPVYSDEVFVRGVNYDIGASSDVASL